MNTFFRYTLLLVLFLVGCGGSTTGTGGVIVGGKLQTANGQALSNVVVTILNTGDTGTTDATGAFSIPTVREANYDLEFEVGQRKVKSSIPNVPDTAKKVTAQFEIDDNDDSTEPSEVEIEEHSHRSNGKPSPTPKPSASPAPSESPTPTPNASASPTPTASLSGEREEIGVISGVSENSLTVGSNTYAVTSSTDIAIEHKRNPTIADLSVGDRIHIHGLYRGGILQATEIEKL